MELLDRALELLNPEQLRVVQHNKGPMAVISGAGSGKTAAITTRIGRLVRDGVAPSRILAVTFSKKGADEMTARARRLVTMPTMRVGTFHSLAFEILKDCDPGYASWEVDVRDAYRWCIKDAVGFRKMKWRGADLALLSEAFAHFKCALVEPSSPELMELAKTFHRDRGRMPALNPVQVVEAYVEAEAIRAERQLLGFDDMLVIANKFLRDEPTRRRWASRFDHVIQDEAQDSANPTARIASALAQDHKNYMVVGDNFQTIYSFRGADAKALLQFEKEWGAEVVRMGRNYRSGRTIIQLANRVTTSMRKEYQSGLVLSAERDLDGEITATRHLDFDEEAVALTERLRLLQAEGVGWSEMAVLYRLNAQSRAPEEALISARIPYRVVGGGNFYARREVRDLLSYLRVALFGTVTDAVKTLNAPNRFLSKKFLDRFESETRGLTTPETDWTATALRVAEMVGCTASQLSALEAWGTLIGETRRRCSDLKWNPSKILEDIVLATDYARWLRQEDGSETVENNRQSNIRELIRAATRFDKVTDLLKYVDLTQRKSVESAGSKTPDAVTLTTIHQSKGLEWKAVSVLGVNEAILPHKRGDLEEERRLFYVACTRAKDHLHLSAVRVAETSSGTMPLEPSRFLTDAEVEVVDVTEPTTLNVMQTLANDVSLNKNDYGF